MSQKLPGQRLEPGRTEEDPVGGGRSQGAIAEKPSTSVLGLGTVGTGVSVVSRGSDKSQVTDECEEEGVGGGD